MQLEAEVHNGLEGVHETNHPFQIKRMGGKIVRSKLCTTNFVATKPKKVDVFTVNF